MAKKVEMSGRDVAKELALARLEVIDKRINELTEIMIHTKNKYELLKEMVDDVDKKKVKLSDDVLKEIYDRKEKYLKDNLSASQEREGLLARREEVIELIKILSSNNGE